MEHSADNNAGSLASTAISATEYTFALTLTKGLATAFIPVLGTAYLFSYELAYCGFFGIPPGLISVSFMNGLLAVVALSSAIAVILVIIGGSVRAVLSLSDATIAYLIVLVLLIDVMAIHSYLSYDFDDAIRRFFIDCGIAAVVATVLAIFWSLRIIPESRALVSLTNVVESIGKTRSLAILLGLFALPASLAGGHYAAAEATDFYETVSSPPYVIAATFNGVLVGIRRFSQRSPFLCSEYRIYPTSKLPTLRYVRGPFLISELTPYGCITRRLTPYVRAALYRSLHSHRGVRIRLLYVYDNVVPGESTKSVDAEVKTYALQLRSVLLQAGWQVDFRGKKFQQPFDLGALLEGKPQQPPASAYPLVLNEAPAAVSEAGQAIAWAFLDAREAALEEQTEFDYVTCSARQDPAVAPPSPPPTALGIVVGPRSPLSTYQMHDVENEVEDCS